MTEKFCDINYTYIHGRALLKPRHVTAAYLNDYFKIYSTVHVFPNLGIQFPFTVISTQIKRIGF